MRRFNQINRILSLVLAIVMIFGMLPVFAQAAENSQVIDAAVIFTDLHTSKSDYKESAVKNVFTAVKNTGLPISSVTSGGDAFSVNESSGQYTGDPTKITGYIRSALGWDVPVNYVWSDHDRYATGIDKDSGFIYGAGADGIYGNADDGNYYIYELSMADLSTNDRYGAGFHSNSEITATIKKFVEDAAKLDQSKPLFIASHQPLFDRRDDNGHALEWCTAINQVAEDMDVAFFFGHNHKYDKAEDYYYAKGSSMPVATSSLSSQNVKLNFTHMCAGYLEPSSTGSTANTTRQGTLMVIQIMEDSIRYTTYNKNGVYTGNYAVDKTVTRDHAVTEPELVVSGTNTYFVGEALNLTVSVKTGSKVEDVTAQATVTGYNMNAAGDYTVTASYNGMTAQYTIHVYQKTFESAGVTVEVTNPGATKLTVTTAAVDSDAVGPMLTDYQGYAINMDGVAQGDTVTVTLPVPAGVTEPAVCYVDNGKLVKVNATVKGNTVSFTTDVFGTFLVGQQGISENLEQSVVAGGTSYEEKTVYEKVDNFENGGKYLIVGEDNVKNANKIAYLNNNGSEGWVVVTPNADNQIELNNANAVWTASGDAKNGYTLINGDKAIGRGKDKETLRNKDQALKVTYDAAATRLKTASGTTRYLYYSTSSGENWKWATSSSSSSSSRNMWIYKQTTIDVPVSSAVTYTVQASGLDVQDGTTAQLQFSLLADGAAATLPAGAGYSFKVVNDTNGIIASISNTGLITFNKVSGSCYVKIACTMAEGTAYKYVKVTNEVTTPECTHNYQSSVTVEPTCAEEGVLTYTCANCGDSYTETIAAVGHAYKAVNVVEPTCTEAGYTTYACANCGDSYTGAEVAALGHSNKSVVTEPTCTEQGYTTHTCTVCGQTTVDSYVEAAHDFNSTKYEPTCSQDGFVKHVCADCGYTEYTDIVDAIGHNYVHQVINGYNVYTCSGCGHSYTDEVVHTYDKVNNISAGNTYVVTIYVSGKYYALSHANNQLSMVEVVKQSNWIASEVTEDLLWDYDGTNLSYESDGLVYRLYSSGNNKDLGVSTTKASVISYSGTKLKIGSYYVRYSSDRIYSSRTAGTAYMFQEG